METKSVLEWHGREHDYNQKSADWYWALGIITVAGAIAAILFGNYLIALLIVCAAVVFALRSAKEPPLHRFRLDERGIFIDEDLHAFDQMLSFTVLEDIEGEFPPMISIRTENWLTPHLLIPLSAVDVDAVYAFFLQHVDEGEHHHSFTDVVAAWLGF